MLSLLLGLTLFVLGTLGVFFIGPYLGIAVFASFTHITPQQLHISFLRPALVVALVTLFGYLLSANYPNKFKNFPIECWLFLIMLFGMLLGAWNAYDSQTAFAYLFVYLKYFVFFILLINIIDTKEKLAVLKGFLILSAAWMVYKCWDLRWTTGGRFENMDGGVVGDSNHFAAALVLLLPLVVVKILSGNKQHILIRIGALIGTFGMLMAIFITGSRSGLLGLIACLLSFLFFEKRSRKVILALILLLGIVAAPFVPETILERVQTIVSSEQGEREYSAQSRLVFWGTAIDVWKNNPIYGCGLRNFLYYNGYENEGKSWGETGHVAHSLWFEALAEGGILVFGSLIALLVMFFYRTSRVKRLCALDYYIVRDINALQSGLIGFLVCATFLNRLIYEPIYWWCGMAYIYHYHLTKK